MQVLFQFFNIQLVNMLCIQMRKDYVIKIKAAVRANDIAPYKQSSLNNMQRFSFVL